MFLFLISCMLCISTNITLASENVTSTVASSKDIDSTINDLTRDKHESLFSCPTISFEDGEYEVFPNGTLYVEAYNKTWNESFYIRINDTISVCAAIDKLVVKDHVVKSTDLTQIGMGISMICLFLHLIIFMIVPDMRNLPGWNLAALCFSLFISYLILFVVSSDIVLENRDACIASASLAHFFLLASFLWMSIMSYDVYMSLLRATGSLRTSSTHFKLKKFLLYCLCAFGIAILFTITAVLSDVLEIVPHHYRPVFEKLCWFSQKTPLLIFFAGPVLILTCINFIFFGLSSYAIHFNKMKKDQDDHRSALRKSCLMYFRLSVIMGITWVVGIVATIANVDWLWYIFVALNTLQGLFIFLAFTCSTKVIKYFRVKLLGSRRSSTQTLAPTFQSYCSYASSIEKDLDKVVDKAKEKADTIIIHL